MTEQAVGWAGGWSWNTRVIGFAALVALLLVAAHAGAPYLFNRATLQSEIDAQVRTTTGLTVASQHARFDLLPSPHVTMRGVRVANASGSLRISADRLDGDVRLLPLVVGRIELADVTLVKPHVAIDLDQSLPDPSTVFGQALSFDPQTIRSRRERLGSISLVEGQIDMGGGRLGHRQRLTDVNLAVDWHDLQSPASLTGSLRASNIDADVALWVAQPLKLMRGDRSALALNIRSIPLEVSATGTFSGAPLFQFVGHVSGAAPDFTALLHLASVKLPLPSRLAGLALSADANVGFARWQVTRLDLQDMKAQADGNVFEGTTAFQNGPTPSITATLATDRLSLSPFLSQAPPMLARGGGWSTERFGALGKRPIDLDLRVSAGRLRAGPFEIEDAAISVLTKNDRVEIGLDEGLIDDGLIKGHASLGFGGGVDVRAAGTIANADLVKLSWDLFGQQVASGQLSGSMNLSAMGETPRQLVDHLQGSTTLSARDGDFSVADLYGLARATTASGPTMFDGSEAQAPFTRSKLDLAFDAGTARIVDGQISSPKVAVDLTGQANLGARVLDVIAALRGGPSANAAPSRFVIDGAFDRLKITRMPAAGPSAPSAP